ncbi:MAG TPA: VIT domain-containing protein, partial [Gemmatimonadaceae bacterium]|nr:VIT domain-containing protein [Gemmatimonadaceae bacterium]
MRTTLLAALASLALLAPATPALGQGRIVPRPCPVPVPRTDDPRPIAPPCVPSPGAVERRRSEVRVELADRVLRYEIRETFVNRGGRVGEADYVFPLPRGAAFQDLRLQIGDELVGGEVLDAAEARRVYENIVRQQKDPALVEWMGRGLLRARIFPIAPGEEKLVVVRYAAVAEREGDAVRVDYGVGSGVGSGVGNGAGATFVLRLPRDGGYGAPYSPTHALDVRERGDWREVRARGDGGAVTVLLPVRRGREASIGVLAHRERAGEDGFALVTVTPPAVRPARTPRDLTFVVDVSGSMGGVKMEQARSAGRQLLATLDPADRFRVIAFSGEVSEFRSGWTAATRENVRAAERYLESLDASGSTNISGALVEALDVPAARGRLPLVLFLTDGEPTVGEWRPEAIAARAAELRGRARVFTFGVGSDVNVALLEQLALEGRGTAHFVRPEEDVERAVSVVAGRLATPVVTDVRVSADGVELRQPHPRGALDLFAGQDLVLLARYRGSGPATVRVEGVTADGPVRWTTRVTFPERARENAFVAKLWATQRVGWLSAERRRNGASPELDEELRALGLRYGIPTELSSYLVLEPGVTVASSGAARRQLSGRPVPAPAPTSAATSATDASGAGGSVRVRGTSAEPAPAAAPPPPAPPAASREQAFEAAKAAAAQRGAVTLADAAGAAAGGDALRQAGGRSFVLRSGVWTDVALASGP